MTIRPRRSLLYMPGSNARALEKAKTLPADGVILDLEDSVAPDAKEAARQQVVDAVKAGGFGAGEVFIRVNGVDTPWHADDLAAPAHVAPDAILVPKISNPEMLEMIGRRLLDMGTDHKTRVWAMIETPLAIFSILSLAPAGSGARLRRQDADPSQPDRALQHGVLAVAGGSLAGAQDDRRLRSAGKQVQRRGLDRRPHGRAPACRHGAAHRG